MKRHHHDNHRYLYLLFGAVALTLILLAGCGKQVPEAYLAEFRYEQAVIYFESWPHPVDTISVSLPDGESALHIWANGFLDREGKYRMELSIDSYGYEIEKRLRFESRDISCTIDGHVMQVVKTHRRKNPIGMYGAMIELIGPVVESDTPDTTLGAGIRPSRHEIVINLTGFVYLNDRAVTIKTIKAFQKRPLPAR